MKLDQVWESVVCEKGINTQQRSFVDGLMGTSLTMAKSLQEDECHQ